MAKTLEDLGRAKKLEYPGEFDDLSDLDLGRQLQFNNPGKYDDYVKAPVERKAQPRSSVSKTIEGAQNVLGAQANIVSRKALAPLIKRFPISDEARSNIEKKLSKKDIIYASDILEEALPFLKEYPQDIAEQYKNQILSDMLKMTTESVKTIAGGEPPSKLLDTLGNLYKGMTNPPEVNLGQMLGVAGRTAARFGIDVAFDPLTWEGGPRVTRLGKLKDIVEHANLLKSIDASKGRIPLKGPLAESIAKEMGVEKLTPTLIKKFRQVKSGANITEKVAQGEFSLGSIGPLELKGPLASKIVEPLAALAKTKAIQKADRIIRPIFSNQIGNKNYDELVNKYRALALHEAGVEIKDAAERNKMLNDLSREMGTPREIIQRQILSIGERVKPITSETISIADFLNDPRIMYHGTYSNSKLATEFGQGEIKAGVGIHLGTKKAAEERLANTPANRPGGKPGSERIIPVQVNLKKPFNTPETALPEDGIELARLGYNQFGSSWKTVRANLKKQGYDGLYYINKAEDPGSVSAYVFDRKSLKTLGEVNKGKLTAKAKIEKNYGSIIEDLIPELKTKNPGRIIRQGIEDHYSEKIIDAKLSLYKAQQLGDQAGVDQASKDIAEYNGLLNEVRGKYSPPTGIDPRVEKAARDIKNTLDNQRLAEEAAGLEAPKLLSNREYITRAATPQTLESLRNKAIAENKLPPNASNKQFSTYVANYMHRQFNTIRPKVVDAWVAVGIIDKRTARALKGKNGPDKAFDLLEQGKITEGQFEDIVYAPTIPEINNLPRAVKERVFGKDVGDIVFHEDPVYYTTIRNIRGKRAILATQFYEEMKARGLAIRSPDAPPDWVNAKPEELTGFKVPPDVARHLNKLNQFSLSPNEFKEALNVYDKFHSLTKAWTLAIFPAYHTKNMVGNFWNNWLSGLNNPLRYLEARKVQVGKDYTLTDIFGTKWNQDELFEATRKLGVLGHGQFAGEGARQYRVITQQLESGKWLTLSSRSNLLRIGRQIGQNIEDNARLAHFIDRVKKGDTFEQAAMSVKKYLFDYQDLTPAERQFFNRVFFFYKWTKENIPLQLHGLITTPWKFGAPFKAKHEIEKVSPPADEHAMAEWMKENFPVRLRWDKKNNRYEYFMLNSWLPAADLLKLSHIHDVAAQMLAPLPKETIQYLWNYDFYFKNKIEKFPGEKKDLNLPLVGKVLLPSKMVHAARIIRLLNEYDKMTSTDSDIYTKLMQLAFGKNQFMDPTQVWLSNKYRVDEEIRALKGGIFREAKKDTINQKEIDRLLRAITEKYQEY